MINANSPPQLLGVPPTRLSPHHGCRPRLSEALGWRRQSWREGASHPGLGLRVFIASDSSVPSCLPRASLWAHVGEVPVCALCPVSDQGV